MIAVQKQLGWLKATWYGVGNAWYLSAAELCMCTVANQVCNALLCCIVLCCC
jgi:hypothetical protein